MNLNESIKRLRFTFLKQNKPNQTDVDALNEILKTIESYQSKNVDDNKLFAKLLCINIKERYLRCNEDINETLKSLSTDLKDPLEFQIEKLSAKIRSTQLINFIKTLKIDVDLENTISVEDWAKKESEFWEQHNRTIIDEILFMNSTEEIRNNFYMTANEILNNENYKV